MGRDIAETKAKWRALVSEQGESGLSVAAFCNQRGLRAWQFYEWKKRVKEPETASFVGGSGCGTGGARAIIGRTKPGV
jgi:hypothetical protein